MDSFKDWLKLMEIGSFTPAIAGFARPIGGMMQRTPPPWNQEDPFFKKNKRKKIVESNYDTTHAQKKILDAFKKIDRHTGDNNFVSLYDLRNETLMPKEEFDNALNDLRKSQVIGLSANEGQVQPEIKEAGIIEMGKFLVFASLKNKY